jgi:hypothetical protein
MGIENGFQSAACGIRGARSRKKDGVGWESATQRIPSQRTVPTSVQPAWRFFKRSSESLIRSHVSVTSRIDARTSPRKSVAPAASGIARAWNPPVQSAVMRNGKIMNQPNGLTTVYSKTFARKSRPAGAGKVKSHSRLHSTRPRS